MSEAGSSPTRIVASPSVAELRDLLLDLGANPLARALCRPSGSPRPETLACPSWRPSSWRRSTTEDRSAYAGVLRYYELAKRAEWQVRELPWNERPPIPEYKGSPQKLARRRDLWRSVIMQQLQADMLAVKMASQLLNAAPHPEARLYYSTMVQDEARHTEAWLKLAEAAGGEAERDPHLDKLAAMFLDLDTLEEKVFLMQVFFERLIIPRFRMIAAALAGDRARGPVQQADRSTTGSTTARAWRTSACCSRTRRSESSSSS